MLIATQVVEQSLDLDFDELAQISRRSISSSSARAVYTAIAGCALRASSARASSCMALPTRTSPRCASGPPNSSTTSAHSGSRLGRCVARCAQSASRYTAVGGGELPPASRVALLSQGGSKLVEAELRRQGELEAKRTKAKQCCIPPTSADPDGGAALDDDDDAVQAFTRDGMSATLLPFWWDEEGARALDAEDTASVWPLDAARSDAWRLAGELLDQTLSLPARAGVEGIVASADGAAWGVWRKRFVRFADESGLGTPRGAASDEA